MNYGTPKSPLVECKKHQQFHASDEQCPWCEPMQPTTTWEDMVALQAGDHEGMWCRYCTALTMYAKNPNGSTYCRVCWGVH